MDTGYTRYEVGRYSIVWTCIDDIPSRQLSWLDLEYLRVRVQFYLRNCSYSWDVLVSHAVSHYDVWIACKELGYIKCACAICWGKDTIDIGAVDLAKDYIEFLCWLFVLWMYYNAAIHAVCNVLPYAVETVSATVVKECACMFG